MDRKFLNSRKVGHSFARFHVVLHKEHGRGTHVGGIMVFVTSLIRVLMLLINNLVGKIVYVMVCTIGHGISYGQKLTRVIRIKFIYMYSLVIISRNGDFEY